MVEEREAPLLFHASLAIGSKFDLQILYQESNLLANLLIYSFEFPIFSNPKYLIRLLRLVECALIFLNL